MHVQYQHRANLAIIGKPTNVWSWSIQFPRLTLGQQKKSTPSPPTHTHHKKEMFLIRCMKSWLLSKSFCFQLVYFWIFIRVIWLKKGTTIEKQYHVLLLIHNMHLPVSDWHIMGFNAFSDIHNKILRRLDPWKGKTLIFGRLTYAYIYNVILQLAEFIIRWSDELYQVKNLLSKCIR